ncbi:Cytochrome P450 4C1 [Orchesella cincta]|uniref:Cytochrome P450 4C1 n=1 Tax=Orchesella cincta TaxID=48709 RepID=A0A1D2MDY2_ORCCI|nr:Cytochrome P450 4C1 [Orchesella cincta]
MILTTEYGEMVQPFENLQWVLAALCIFLICILKLYEKSTPKNVADRKTSRFENLPGPGHYLWGSYSNIFALRDMKECLKVIRNWCADYGPIFKVRLGPLQYVVLNSPEYIQKLMGSRDMSYFGKGFAYEPFKPFWKDGLIISKGEKWKFRRKVLTKHLFSFKTLLSYMKVFNEEADTLVQTLGEMYADGKEKGIEELLMHSSLNTITKAVLGKNVAEIETMDEGDLSVTETVIKVKDVVSMRVLSPWLLSDFIWRLHPMSKVADFVEKMSWKHITNAMKSTNNNSLGIKKDLMAAGISFEGVLEEGSTLISAGHETTATSLHFLLFCLALHPHHQKLCREEVDSIYEDVDLCSGENIQFRALIKLRHLELCVYEALRLLPTVFLMMRKIEAPLEIEEDLILPSGTEICIFTQGLHMNPEYFPEPNSFIPERFSREESKNRHPHAFIAFSAGPRRCIGQKFAMMEMLTLTAKILRHYDISTSDKLQDVVLLPIITLTPEKPMNFLFTKPCLNVIEGWCRKYGPVFTVNFGPSLPITFLNSPEYIQKLLASTDMGHIGKGFIYEPLKPVWNDGLIISNGEKWKTRRRLLTKHIFSFKSFVAYMKIFQEEADTLIETLGEMFQNGEENEIDDVLLRASFNAVAKAALGKCATEIEVPDETNNFSLFETVKKIKEVVATRVINPWLLFNPIWRLHPLSKVETGLVQNVWKYGHRCISDDENKNALKEDLLAAGVSIEGILEESVTLISAGYETTGISLQFLFFFLALYPEHQEKCRTEVDALFETSEDLQYKSLGKMKHLEMCVNETFRLLPTVFVMMRKIETPLQLETDLEIPGGSQISIFVPGLHKNPQYFPEPDKFIPERFLEKESKARHNYSFVPFSGGTRMCIGYKFAMMEIMSLTSKILRHFVISTNDKYEDLVCLPHVTLTPQKPIKFIFKRR